MAIVRLYDIVNLNSGVTSLPNNYKKDGKYYFVDYKTVFNKNIINDSFYNNLNKILIMEKDIKKYTSYKNNLLCTWSSENNKDIFQISIVETNKPLIINGFSKIISLNSKDILPKWLYYYLNSHKNIQKIRESIVYTTRCNMKNEYLKWILIDTIPIIKQQKIIDIIEPFENKLNELTSKLNIIMDIENILLNYSNLIGYMIDNHIIIEKGKSIKSNMLTNNITSLPFVNVSYINNKINKYVASNSISANVNLGDVLLSLDGTPGLVNNFVYGFNGYGYKLWSKTIDNYVIYYSLLHKCNKNLIQNNSKGSVILHSSSSKNKLLLFSFKYSYELKIIYEYSFELKKQVKCIKNIINLLIRFLILN